MELVKSSVDNRYSSTAVVSHDGATFPCTPVTEMEFLEEKLGTRRFAEVFPFSEISKSEIVASLEFQLTVCSHLGYDRRLMLLQLTRHNLSKESQAGAKWLLILSEKQLLLLDWMVILDGSIKIPPLFLFFLLGISASSSETFEFREKFGELVDMVPIADTITKLSAKCGIRGCLQKALFTSSRFPSEEIEVVGGAERYIPVCRYHYLDRSLNSVLNCGR